MSRAVKPPRPHHVAARHRPRGPGRFDDLPKFGEGGKVSSALVCWQGRAGRRGPQGARPTCRSRRYADGPPWNDACAGPAASAASVAGAGHHEMAHWPTTLAAAGAAVVFFSAFGQVPLALEARLRLMLTTSDGSALWAAIPPGRDLRPPRWRSPWCSTNRTATARAPPRESRRRRIWLSPGPPRSPSHERLRVAVVGRFPFCLPLAPVQFTPADHVEVGNGDCPALPSITADFRLRPPGEMAVDRGAPSGHLWRPP